MVARRNVLKNLILGGTAIAMNPSVSFASSSGTPDKTALRGNIHHSVCRWTYGFLSLDELCTVVRNIGFSAI
ncbi:MAG: hydroxypyruvate isomerase, partial [Flavisolibacter sp.]